MTHLSDCVLVNQVSQWTSPKYLLIQEDFRLLSAGRNGLLQPPHTEWICPRSLQKPTIATQHIRHAILRCSVELWPLN